jgi:hypothetical protein
MDANYSIVNATQKTEAALIEAVKLSKVENITSPRRTMREMILPQAKFSASTLMSRAGARLNGRPIRQHS